MNLAQLSQVIKARRSVFPAMYNDIPIAKETIVQILENANWAPTHKKTEPWRWKVMQGNKLKDFSEYLKNHYLQHTPADKYSELKLKKTVAKPLMSQAVIAICMYNDPATSVPEWEELAAVAMAVQNMWLCCTTLGIGAYWSSPQSALDAKDFLQLAEHEKCLGWFYMGYYPPTDLPKARSSSESKTTWL